MVGKSRFSIHIKLMPIIDTDSAGSAPVPPPAHELLRLDVQFLEEDRMLLSHAYNPLTDHHLRYIDITYAYLHQPASDMCTSLRNSYSLTANLSVHHAAQH